ncbi:MAG TPA: hypothetical protein VMH84_17345 [Xanthobacteraceae bacterium]|nr:hypothetical protein [Xanthobacteraceae bacterium]
MPRDGAIIFGDLACLLLFIKVACSKCPCAGRYRVGNLTEQYGRNGKIVDWLNELAKDCPKRQSGSMSDVCGAYCPGLPKVL